MQSLSRAAGPDMRPGMSEERGATEPAEALRTDRSVFGQLVCGADPCLMAADQVVDRFRRRCAP
jgi:hypothetical protein